MSVAYRKMAALALVLLLALPQTLPAAGKEAGNRLIKEKSPYLLQHAYNPVDWYPWGDEAFAKARREKKLIFLSIGYSTCHWCHVMAHESFEDEAVAALLDKEFVAIKVDREERPDVDQVYMDVCVRLTGSGGWPLTIIMTPDGHPVFAGTYIPKEPRYGRTGLLQLLRQTALSWQQDPGKMRRSGREIVARLQVQEAATAVREQIGGQTLTEAAKAMSQSFDSRHGGFGGAPKFPRPHSLVFLLRQHRRTGDRQLLKMAEETLSAMRRGGIYDHVGFGFHRYSTDASWLVPHFEKMLYDQAGLAIAYIEAYQATGRREYAQTVREIFDYVLRDMTDPLGGFYSAEDADSEGVEGKFYVWSQGEIIEALGKEGGELFGRIYGVKKSGNYSAEVPGEPPGANILHLDRPLRSWAKKLKLERGQIAGRLERSRLTLLEERQGRVPPHKDDKVITAWNGLMISALARGSVALDEPVYAEAAGGAADFLLSALRTGEGRLLRRYREGEAAIPAFAEDYAFLSRGLIDLYGATYEPRRLSQALKLADDLERLFADESGGGIFDAAVDSERLIVRPKKVYDGAIPSANSVALEVFTRLFLLTGDARWDRRAQQMLKGLSGQVGRYPAGYTQLLQGAALVLGPTREVVVSGVAGAEDTVRMLELLRGSYAPETTVLLRPEGDEEIGRLAPYTAGMKMVDGKAAAYVCQNFACSRPVTDPEALRRLLEKAP